MDWNKPSICGYEVCMWSQSLVWAYTLHKKGKNSVYKNVCMSRDWWIVMEQVIFSHGHEIRVRQGTPVLCSKPHWAKNQPNYTFHIGIGALWFEHSNKTYSIVRKMQNHNNQLRMHQCNMLFMTSVLAL